MDYQATNIYPGPVQYGGLQQPSQLQRSDYDEPAHDVVTTMIDRQRPPLKTTMIKKATSSPNVRSLVSPDTAQMSAADKKRNKLGYHRTAVACGHCRRRKIRCIPSSDTTTTRCQNCIRLKKDCQFYPVDQNTQPNSKRHRNDSKGDALTTESETSVSSSSPGLQTGTIDHYEQYRPSIGSPPLSQGATGYPPITTSSGLPGQSDHDYEYSPSYPNTTWPPSAAVNQSQRYFGDARHQPEPHGRNFWPEHEQSHAPAFAPSSFSMSSNPSTVAVTASENPYSYPTTTQEYQYSPQTPREAGISSSSSMLPYAIYRSNTMPDMNQPMTTRNVHQPSMNMSPQTMMSPQFSGQRQQNQYQQPPGIAPRWTEQSHIQPGYLPNSNGQNWFNAAAGLTNVREEQEPHTQVLPSQQVTPGQFRPNPG